MEESGKNIKTKFVVLCREYNMLEDYITPYTEKADNMIKWLKK
jgi:hypothetical protein